MATCPKCGKHPIPRRKDKRRRCPHCGFLPMDKGYDRCGEIQAPPPLYDESFNEAAILDA